jgi:alanine dehydrogenase
MKIGIIREGKIPQDKRVPFTPVQCKFLLETYSDLQIAVQPCAYRCYTDDEYKLQGVTLQDDLSDCDILMGVKEVPVENLISGKKYLFFSHTIKKQPYNKKLLQAVLKNNIQLIDYECLVDENFNRVIGFGRYAGIVGAYNGIMGYGLKYGMFNLKPAHLCHDKKELFHELEKANLPNIKIVVTGGGRVANGALETLGALEIRKVTPYEFLNYTFREPVYVQIHSKDFHALKNGAGWSSEEFYNHPELFNSTFSTPGSYADNCDLLIHCTYWNPQAPVLFTKEQMKGPKFKVSVIADVTCDINGSIPSTTHPSTIENKFYGYNPHTEKEDEAFAPSTITVMAVDNLPCELPRDASEGFGKDLMEKVIPSLIGDDNGLVERGSITLDGKLTSRFEYLADYAVN